jgi:pyruvate-formate lyase-activating enzyme
LLEGNANNQLVSDEPIENKGIQFVADTKGAFATKLGREELGTVYTDSKGYFSFTYECVEKASGATVVMDLGNNDLLQPETVRSIFALAQDSPRIVVVNTAVPRPYRDANNQIIEEVAQEFSNVRVVDWNEISKDHPEYFAPDGVHLVPTGVTAYVMAIDEALK